MTEGKDTPRCAACPLRKRAEARSKSLLGRVWFWHIKWCPGWKAYQDYLARSHVAPGRSRLSRW